MNFLDVTFNLANDSYRPYMKPNNKLQVSRLAKTFSTKPSPHTKRPLTKADTITNYRTTPLQSKQPETKGIGEGTLHGITPHGTQM